MNLSFKPSCAGVSLWWAIAWRGLAISMLLIVPIVLLLIAVQLTVGLGLIGAYSVSPYLGLAVTVGFIVLNVFIQWFFIPVAVYSGVFRWLFSRGRFGGYAISGAHRGQPVNSIGKAIKFSAWFYLENFKYVWPLFVGGILIGLMADEQGNFPPYVGLPLLLFLPLSIYLYMLVVADLIKRRKFSKVELVVVPLAGKLEAPKVLESIATTQSPKPAAAKPVTKAVAVTPVVKAAVKATAKPVAKAKPKPVAKPVAKPAAKPVAKAKPKAKKK